jgi:hypothetical protein
MRIGGGWSYFTNVTSAVSIATTYWLDNQGVGVRVPVEQEFSLLYSIEPGSGAHPVSYPMDKGALFPGIKWPEYETDRSPPTSSEVKKTWIHTFTSPYVFMV